jgi:hypothetical protein
VLVSVELAAAGASATWWPGELCAPVVGDTVSGPSPAMVAGDGVSVDGVPVDGASVDGVSVDGASVVAAGPSPSVTPPTAAAAASSADWDGGGLGVAFFATAFLGAAALSLSPYSSLSRRSTGASTVDDADLTNSPMSFRVARTILLSTPSSFASSCTRTFATALPLVRARSGGDRSSDVHDHLEDFIECS